MLSRPCPLLRQMLVPVAPAAAAGTPKAGFVLRCQCAAWNGSGTAQGWRRHWRVQRTSLHWRRVHCIALSTLLLRQKLTDGLECEGTRLPTARQVALALGERSAGRRGEASVPSPPYARLAECPHSTPRNTYERPASSVTVICMHTHETYIDQRTPEVARVLTQCSSSY